MDAITMLREDHDNVRKLFIRFEHAGDNAHAEKRRLVDRMIEELTVHTYLEEHFFYPIVAGLDRPKGKGEDPDDLVKEAREEHVQVKRLLAELEEMSPEDETFDTKVKVVMDDVRHHAEEEEQEMFPEVRDAMGRSELQELGQQMLEAKANAPKKPSQAEDAA